MRGRLYGRVVAASAAIRGPRIFPKFPRTSAYTRPDAGSDASPSIAATGRAGPPAWSAERRDAYSAHRRRDGLLRRHHPKKTPAFAPCEEQRTTAMLST